MAEITKLQVASIGDGHFIVPRRILAGARRNNLIEVVVIGKDSDGELYLAASHGGPTTLWLIEKAKATLLDSIRYP